MLIEQTLTRLHELKLTGMADALEEQRGVPDVQTLPFEDRFALLLERESELPAPVQARCSAVCRPQCPSG